MINIIGLGYIGLPTALMFAANSNLVRGIDININTIKNLQNGRLTFKEDGLEELYLRARDNIEFQTEIKEDDFYIIAVATPYIEESKQIDPSYLINAFKSVISVCKNESIVVIESTVSPKTIDRYIRPLLNDINKKIHLVHAPERILPGNMIYELVNNSRTIGADDKYIANIVKQKYQTFCKGEIYLTSIEVAEMSKVVENTFRDINIAFSNELLKICNEANIDVYEVIKIANKHPRVNILNPGPGVGGHCISVDPWFLVGDYPKQAKLINQARLTNDNQPKYVLDKLLSISSKYNIPTSKIGLYGLTYKENVDDLRDSPTFQLLKFAKNINILDFKLYDPFINEIKYDNQYIDFDKFLNDIKLIVILVGHNHIKDNFDKIDKLIVFDTKNIYSKGIKL